MLTEVVLSGFGGQGALLAGQILAMAGILEGNNATWLPTYGMEKRGGIALCDVILSDEKIGSPVVDEPPVVVAMDERSFLRYEDAIPKGGTMIYNSSLVQARCQRDDITYIAIPSNQIADELGSDKVNNMIMLGAYVAYSHVVSIDTVITALREKMGAGKEKLIPLNRKAMECGAAYIRQE